MKKLITPLLVFALLLVSCEDNLTDMNQDPKRPNQVPAENLFSNAQVSLGTYLNSSDINSNIFKLMAQYWASTTYATESQYELTTRSIPSNLWSELYRDVLFDLDDAATKTNNDNLLSDAEKQNRIAMIEVLKVLTYYELVTIFGDIPYSEALDPDNTQPVFDNAETVYTDLMDRLNTAISNLNPSADGFGDADIYYGGDIAAWQKFANSLKLRLGITIADSNPSAAQTAIGAAAPNAFTSNADNAVIPFQSTPPHTNPLWEDLVQSGRHDYVPANTIVDMMNNLDDPRRPVHFTLAPDTNTYIGGVYGTTNTYPNFSHFGETLKTANFEGMIMGYDEVEFILAEAALRGYSVGGTAQSHYNAAVRADMEYWGVADSEINDYLNPATGPAAYPATGTDQQQMDAIATQKYLGLWLQGLQAWTEWRRLDAPTFNPPPVRSMTEDDIPTRFIYPVDEQNLNTANYEQAAQAIGGDELTNQLFWDVN